MSTRTQIRYHGSQTHLHGVITLADLGPCDCATCPPGRVYLEGIVNGPPREDGRVLHVEMEHVRPESFTRITAEVSS